MQIIDTIEACHDMYEFDWSPLASDWSVDNPQVFMVLNNHVCFQVVCRFYWREQKMYCWKLWFTRKYIEWEWERERKEKEEAADKTEEGNIIKNQQQNITVTF